MNKYDTQTYSLYKYNIYKDDDQSQWSFIIHDVYENYDGTADSLESDEWYETFDAADNAAMDRIDLLENGE